MTLNPQTKRHDSLRVDGQQEWPDHPTIIPRETHETKTPTKGETRRARLSILHQSWAETSGGRLDITSASFPCVIKSHIRSNQCHFSEQEQRHPPDDRLISPPFGHIRMYISYTPRARPCHFPHSLVFCVITNLVVECEKKVACRLGCPRNQSPFVFCSSSTPDRSGRCRCILVDLPETAREKTRDKCKDGRM
jgi:hypothetical protein